MGDQVEAGAQAFALVVQGQRANTDIARLLVDHRVTVLQASVEAYAEAALVAKAPADIEVAADLRVLGVAGGVAGQVFIQGALGHHVDHAAYRAVG